MPGLHDQWIQEACDANGCPELAKGIRWEWNNRFTRRMGDASWHLKRIRLSRPLWPRATDEQRRETVMHEACHLIAYHLYGPSAWNHGKLWKATMVRAGLSPNRAFKVDRTGLAQSRSKYAFNCRCQTFWFGSVRAKRIAAGRKYRCPKCKNVLKKA